MCTTSGAKCTKANSMTTNFTTLSRRPWIIKSILVTLSILRHLVFRPVPDSVTRWLTCPNRQLSWSQAAVTMICVLNKSRHSWMTCTSSCLTKRFGSLSSTPITLWGSNTSVTRQSRWWVTGLQSKKSWYLAGFKIILKTRARSQMRKSH